MKNSKQKNLLSVNQFQQQLDEVVKANYFSNDDRKQNKISVSQFLMKNRDKDTQNLIEIQNQQNEKYQKRIKNLGSVSSDMKQLYFQKSLKELQKEGIKQICFQNDKVKMLEQNQNENNQVIIKENTRLGMDHSNLFKNQQLFVEADRNEDNEFKIPFPVDLSNLQNIQQEYKFQGQKIKESIGLFVADQYRKKRELKAESKNKNFIDQIERINSTYISQKFQNNSQNQQNKKNDYQADNESNNYLDQLSVSETQKSFNKTQKSEISKYSKASNFSTKTMKLQINKLSKAGKLLFLKKTNLKNSIF